MENIHETDAIQAAYWAWGIFIEDLQNRSDEELVLMRQMVCYRLADFISKKRISEIIDRSEATVETDIYNHEQMVEDKVDRYIENYERYLECERELI